MDATPITTRPDLMARLRSNGPLTVAAAVLALLVLAAELSGSRILVSLLAQAAIISILALGVGMLGRSLNLISFGHAAPFGVGAYGAAYVLSSGVTAPEIGLLLMLVLVFASFFLIGLVASRLEGIAFSMLTLALGQAAYVAISKFRDVTGGADGMIVATPRRLFGIPASTFQDPHGMLLLGVAVMGLVYAGLRALERSKLGELTVAIRENEERVQFLGYRTRAVKAGVFALSASTAALSGALFALYQGFISPEIMHWSFSGSALIMMILGGTSFLWGPIAGAFGYFLLREGLSDLTSHWMAVLGVTLIMVTVAWPSGLSGAFSALLQRLGRAHRSGPKS